MKRKLMLSLAAGIGLLMLTAFWASLDRQHVRADPASVKEGATNRALTVTIVGSMDQSQLQPLLDEFTNRTGSATAYEQTDDQSRLRDCDASQSCPDVAMVPWPGLLDELASEGALVDLSSFISSTVLNTNYSQTWIDLGTVDGTLYAVWFNGGNGSLIWHDPTEFAARGWTTPTTWTELIALSEEISSATGTAPWSIGNESGGATGWPLTDWFEDILLRSAGPQVYDDLVAHEIPWTHSDVLSAATYFGQILGNEHYQLGGKEGTLSTSFYDAALPPFEEPPRAYLHRQAHFAKDWIAAEFPDQAAGTDYGIFPFPRIGSAHGDAVRGWGDFAMVFSDTTAARSLINFLITTDAGEAWVSEGNLSPNRSVDLGLYPDPNSRAAAEGLANADVFRFDLVDQLPWDLKEYVTSQIDDLVRAAPDQEAMRAVLTRIEWKASGTLNRVHLPLITRQRLPTIVKVVPRRSTVSVGEHFTISVVIDNGTDLGSFEFQLGFDPSVVHARGAEVGSFPGSTGLSIVTLGPEIDNDTGTVILGAVSMGDGEGPTGTGVLANVSLEAVGAGSSSLNLHDVDIFNTAGDSQGVAVQHGSVAVEPATCEVFALPVESRIPSVDEGDHVIGPEGAEITFIEYADFQCPACSGLQDLRDYLAERYGDHLRFVYRHLPLVSIHDKAMITAEASEAAAAQGRFWEMHDLLYQKQQEWRQLSVDAVFDKLIEYAGELELDTERFETELSEHVYREQILADYEAYQEYGQMATPTYVINKIFYPTREFGGFGRLEAFIALVLMQDVMYDSPPSQVIEPDKDYQATIRTTKGDITVELFGDQTPTNVNSFAFLAQEGWYDGLDFCFVDHDRVALSGDPTNTGEGLPYPGYTCEDETRPDLTFDEAGLLALYTPAPNRNSSSFFITYVPLPDFTGNFTIIGRVTAGMDVAESLTETQPGPDQPEPDAIETIVIEEQ